MKNEEFLKLAHVYGFAKAEKAARWFVATYSAAFRASVHAAVFCRDNEYLWI